MFTQKGIKKHSLLKKEFIGANPIIHFFIEKLRVKEIISSCIKQDDRLSIPIEKTLSVLIHNILTSPSPMYEIADWIRPISESSLGLAKNEGELVNDYRIGRSLDMFSEGKHKDVFFRLSLRAIKVFKLDCSQIHQDTTSITLSGQYKDWKADQLLTFGKNKDHRPDLKQLVLGMSVTSDGSVPLVHKVYDGNQTDDTLHVDNHQRLIELLKKIDFIYTADSKLSTNSNLKKITSCGGKFVSVMPATWKEDNLFRKKIVANEIKWKHLLSRKNNRHPDSKNDRYYLATGKHETTQGYSLLWIKSSQKMEQDKKTRERNIQRAIEELSGLIPKLNKRKLKSKKNIKEAILKIIMKRNCKKFIDFKIKNEKIYKKHFLKKGRPTPGEKATLTWMQEFSISFNKNQEQISQTELSDGIFPLITNIYPDYSAKKILEIYKYQPFLEKRHSQLKTWQVITPILFKKGIRVVAYIHIHVIALMISALIERTLRLAMLKNSIESLPIYPDDKKCEYQTTYGIVRLFRDVEKYEVKNKDEVMYFPASLSKLQKQILKLLSVPESLYQ